MHFYKCIAYSICKIFVYFVYGLQNKFFLCNLNYNELLNYNADHKIRMNFKGPAIVMPSADFVKTGEMYEYV